tara:strand:+ start:1321 stop:2133 length:813 start_codon:yes stop_codon:yes gene_type:complete
MEELDNRQQTKDFITKNMKGVGLFIAVPCFGGNMELGFVNSLSALQRELVYFQIPFSVSYIASESLIPRGRNSFVANFLEQKQFSHLLFLDADLVFEGHTIIQMLIAKLDICGCPYPKKKINWDIARELIKKGANNETIEGNTSDLNWNTIQPRNENEVFVECKDIPTGCMLIHRPVFYSLMRKYPERKYRNNTFGYTGKLFYDFFGVGVVEGIYLSEDYYFCYLCRLAGYQLFLDKSGQIGHTGKYTYRADINTTIKYNLNSLQLDLKA